MGVVAGANGSVSRTPSLKTLSDVVAGDLTAVNTLIVERMQSPVALIPQLASHVIAAGGKRLRPMLTLATSRLAGYRGSRHLRLAACVEFIHTATLLHDDVVDASDLRRGHASANTLWGNKSSVLVGDFLFSRAFELMVEDGSPAVLAILSRASSVIAEGEVAQLITTGDVETTEDAYMAVIRAKTAQLFAAACRIGAVVAGRPAEDEAALDAFGMNLGIAFQLVDDVLDYSAVQATLGKTIGDDFREGKMTLPVVLALARAGDAERTFWARTIGDMEQIPADLEHAIEVVRTCGALDDTLARARDYARAAATALDRFDDGPEKRALVDVVDFCIGRTY